MGIAHGEVTTSPGPRVHVFGPGAHARRSAEWIARRMRRAASYRGRFALGLAGGSVARGIYEALSEIRGLPWRKAEIYFSDEALGSPGEERSNYRMVRESLLSRVAVREDRIHRMAGRDGDPELAAREYAEELPARFDLLLLSLGEDGRVASLVPGSPALEEEEWRVVPVTLPEEPGVRLTLAPPAMHGARNTAVLATGSERGPAVSSALAGDGSIRECPGRLVRSGHWLLDSNAAAGLERRSG